MATNHNLKLPGAPVDRICPDVTPIEGEQGRYYVRSRSDGGKVYLVDLFENGFVGKCNCPHFEFKIQRDLDRGINPNGNQFCYHIKRAERCFCEMMKRALWASGQQVAEVRTMVPGKTPFYRRNNRPDVGLKDGRGNPAAGQTCNAAPDVGDRVRIPARDGYSRTKTPGPGSAAERCAAPAAPLSRRPTIEDAEFVP